VAARVATENWDSDASSRPGARHDPAAALLGVIVAGASLCAAIGVATGLDQISNAELWSGVVVLVVALALRAGTALSADAALLARARRVRRRWHDESAGALAGATPADLHAIEAAIDKVSAGPSLDATAAGAIASLGALAILYLAEGWLPTAIVIALMVACVPAYVAAGRQAEAHASEFHRRRGALVARQLSLLRAMTDLRALGAVHQGANEVAAQSAAEGRVVIEGVRVTIRSSLVTEFLGGVSVGLVAMVVGLRLWHHHTTLTRALVAVLVVAELVLWLRRLGGEFHRRDDAAQGRATLAEMSSPTHLHIAAAPLELRGVGTEAPAAPVDLVLERGGRTRVEGPSGIGKTLLIEAALGLRRPCEGEVRRGARRIGLIRSDSRLLSGSLRDNLDPDGRHGDDEIIAALDEVGLPHARFGELQDDVLAYGRSVSSGERVLIALARSLLARADLLVLDDVAGLLDGAARARVREILARLDGVAILETAHDAHLVEGARVINLVAR
jgi:ABC-type transport system involved in cytochrome bd biosynthesis fused ATPase/permease subunit